jgi:hypothetical protein
MSDTQLTGGCLCGAVRYTLAAPVHDVIHCHCSMCRKAHGALFVSFGLAPADAFTFQSGEDNLGDFESSPGSHRVFCRTCGGQVINRVDKWPDQVFIALGSLDPGQAPGHEPGHERHIFWESRNGWYEPADDLPKDTGYGDPT